MKKSVVFTLLCILLLNIPVYGNGEDKDKDIYQVSLSPFSSAIVKEGKLWTFGLNSDYKLGITNSHPLISEIHLDKYTFNIAKFPVFIDDEIKNVKMGMSSLYYIKEGGKLWITGQDHSKEVKDKAYSLTKPTKVFEGMRAIAEGLSISSETFIKNDNSLWYIGSRRNLSLALEDRTNLLPIKIMDDVKSAFCINDINLVIKQDNSLWTFGLNHYGELLDGTRDLISKPKKVMEDVKDVKTDSMLTYVLKLDGTLLKGGTELGKGKFDPDNFYKTPIVIAKDVKMMAVGSDMVHYIDNQDTLWAMGKNSNGQLGDGTTIDRKLPVKIAEDVSSVYTSIKHGIYILKDNSIWSFGRNDLGQIGDGTTIDRPTPVEIVIPDEDMTQVNIGARYHPVDVAFNLQTVRVPAYYIKGYHYFKLRDMAKLCKNTSKPFNVMYENKDKKVVIYLNQEYKLTGNEFLEESSPVVLASPSDNKLYVDDYKEGLLFYKINNENYFKLRDLARIIGFEVEWDNYIKMIRVNINLDNK